MKKLTMAASAAIAAVFLTPALAHAGTIRGTVAAKQANRHVLVIAMRHGRVTTARVSARQLFPFLRRRRRALRNGKRRRIEALQAIDVAQVVLDGDPHRHVLAERHFLGRDLHVQVEGLRLGQNGEQQRGQQRHAPRLRERARNSAASGAT